MNKSGIIIIVLTLLCSITNGCTHDVSKIKDNGDWVKLDPGTPQNGYTLYRGHIYGVRIDADSFYEDFEPLYGIDIESFRVCRNSLYAKDRTKVYFPKDQYEVDGEDFSYGIYDDVLIKEADAPTFKYLGDDYAVDKYNMYYEGKVIPWNEDILKKYNR